MWVSNGYVSSSKVAYSPIPLMPAYALYGGFAASLGLTFAAHKCS